MQNGSIKGRVMEYIAAYTDAHGFAPTYREIGRAIGLRSPSSVSRYVEELKLDGKLKTIGQRPRTVAPVRKVALGASQRIRLEVADGGVLFFDCNMAKDSVTFSGVLDASQIKGKVGRVVNCRVDGGE